MHAQPRGKGRQICQKRKGSGDRLRPCRKIVVQRCTTLYRTFESLAVGPTLETLALLVVSTTVRQAG